MNQRYIDYAAYNIWANDLLTNALLQQEEEFLTRKLEGSFPNIRATLLHIWFAEMGWLSRLEGKGWEASAVDNFSGDAAALCKDWQATSLAFKSFVETANLEKTVFFEHKGNDYHIPSREISQTVFNHGTYHRGQVIMMMRQLSLTDVPKTDYIEWVRQQVEVGME